MDQIIDTPFAVNSQHVGLVQMADLYAAIFRRYAELHDYEIDQDYPGQIVHIDAWVTTLAQRLLAKANRWSKQSTSDCMRWYVALAPRSLLAL